MTVYNDQISEYINGLFVRNDGVLEATRKNSVESGLPPISIKPEEGQFLQLLVRACGARKALEIGTLGGYSGIWILRGLLPGGKLITLEREPHHAQVARQHFDQAGVGDRVEIRLGNAHQSLKGLVDEGPFDFVFIDAEKPGYSAYFDWALENTRLGGTIATHNAFRKGSILGQGPADEFTPHTIAFNQKVAAEPRVISTIYPAGDGMLIAVRIA